MAKEEDIVIDGIINKLKPIKFRCIDYLTINSIFSILLIFFFVLPHGKPFSRNFVF